HEFLRRQQALKALQRYATVSERCLDGLCEAAGDGDERVVVAAVAALGQLAHERALPTLEKARSHPNTRVRVIAEEAIARLRGGFALKSPR
ncbi:MAG: HEAT repeat domain-containing protein, partial [Elusimicrobia bacterium]|nr:HEAT repeat domain-containing protein [Elusimicrobiota bacterium]